MNVGVVTSIINTNGLDPSNLNSGGHTM